MQDLIMQCKAQPEAASAVLDALRSVYTKGHIHAIEGMCSNVSRELDNAAIEVCAIDWLPLLWVSWPEWSGDDTYPVPPHRSSTILDRARQAYNLTRNLWDRDTEYGQLRWELLEHCIKTLQEAIEHANQD